MKWAKRGLIFVPPDNLPWSVSHAALPVADQIGADCFRVYFSGRDRKGRAQIGAFDLQMDTTVRVLNVSEKPLISLGPLGSFDDSGITSSWVVNHRDRKYCYYSGWSLGVTVPFYFYVGLAVSDDNGESFRKISNAPILERNPIDPYLTASPCVLIENDIWRMWYISCTGWEINDKGSKHYYLVKYAESSDGINWNRTGIICIGFQSRDEYAIARPCVIRKEGIYKMWYSYRGESYRIGYAESVDGLKWERKDGEVGIDVSDSGWDSEMIEYPYVFDYKEHRYMLYNGNAYGRSGIGLAIAQQV
jgi:hypothetical protein